MAFYDRNAAVMYAEKWALKRNPRYYDFDGLGGDCTNFISQCIYAGAGVMNFGAKGWYYINLNRRTPSWTGVGFLYEFLTTNKGAGPYASTVSAVKDIKTGDVIQLKRNGRWTHSLFVTKISAEPSVIFVSTHTYDSLNKPLYLYWYDDIRFIHIKGVR